MSSFGGDVVFSVDPSFNSFFFGGASGAIRLYFNSAGAGNTERVSSPPICKARVGFLVMWKHVELSIKI